MSQLVERMHAAEGRARALRAEADKADAEAAMLRRQIADADAATRVASLAEESVQSVNIYDSLCNHVGVVEMILGPWMTTGYGSRRRLMGIGRAGKLLAVYEIRDTKRARGDVRIQQIHGAPVPMNVHLTLERRFQ